jgi:hypothetical protein
MENENLPAYNLEDYEIDELKDTIQDLIKKDPQVS